MMLRGSIPCISPPSCRMAPPPHSAPTHTSISCPLGPDLASTSGPHTAVLLAASCQGLLGGEGMRKPSWERRAICSPQPRSPEGSQKQV